MEKFAGTVTEMTMRHTNLVDLDTNCLLWDCRYMDYKVVSF